MKIYVYIAVMLCVFASVANALALVLVSAKSVDIGNKRSTFNALSISIVMGLVSFVSVWNGVQINDQIKPIN